MIDEDFIKALLSKHTFLEFNHQTDYLTLDCPAENIIDFTKLVKKHTLFLRNQLPFGGEIIHRKMNSDMIFSSS